MAVSRRPAARRRHGLAAIRALLLAASVVSLPACGTGRSAQKETAAAPSGACQGQFQKKVQDMTADLQKMGDQDYKVEMSDSESGGGVTIYARTMPRAVRQYLTASHVDTVPEIRLANHRGYYQIRPRPSRGCGLDYLVRFVAP
jgi:hypothetical protein